MNLVRNPARRPTLQLQLALLYAGVSAGLFLAVLAATNLIGERGRTPAGEQVPRLNIAGAAVFVPVAVVAALVLGWVIAGRLFGPCAPSQRQRGTSRPPTCGDAWTSEGPTTSSSSSGTPSTTSSGDSTPRSMRNGTLSPMPPTNCEPLSPDNVPCSK